MEDKLFNECQSGFMPGDSCVSQLLSSTHDIYKSFGCNPPADVRETSLEFQKLASDKVRHDDLILKLDGNLLKLLKNYLKD